MTVALADLIQPMTQQQAFALVLSQYQSAGFPVQSWQTGGVERTRAMAIATGLASLSNYIPAVAGGALLDYAPNFPNWTALTAAQFYQLQQNQAAFTVGNILATNTSSQAYTFTAGNLIVVFGATLNRYRSVGGGTIPAQVAGVPGTLSIPVVAEFAGASYSDPNNSGAITLVSPLPGVTITNPASTYSDVTHTGSGTGTLTLAGAPTGPHSVQISVTATSAVAPATLSYTLDSTAAVSLGTVSSVTNLGGVGINITLVNGVTGASWVSGDAYTFTAPGSWITSQGADIETDIALAQRCRNKWATQSNVPTQSLYQFLVTSEPTYGPQVTQVITVPDGVINNKVNVVVAGPLGVLPAAAITGLQSYLTLRARGCDVPVVQSPTSLNVTLAGTITCSASLLATVQTAVQTAMSALVLAVGINGTLRIADIIQTVMDISGVVDCSSVTINSVASNLTLGSSSSFVLASLQPLAFGYVTV